MSQNYLVCKFNDGLSIVASKWMDGPSHCYYPPKQEYKIALRKLKSPSKTGTKSWNLLEAKVKRTCETLQGAMNCAKIMSSQPSTSESSNETSNTPIVHVKRTRKVKQDDTFLYNNSELFKVPINDSDLELMNHCEMLSQQAVESNIGSQDPLVIEPTQFEQQNKSNAKHSADVHAIDDDDELDFENQTSSGNVEKSADERHDPDYDDHDSEERDSIPAYEDQENSENVNQSNNYSLHEEAYELISENEFRKVSKVKITFLISFFFWKDM